MKLKDTTSSAMACVVHWAVDRVKTLVDQNYTSEMFLINQCIFPVRGRSLVVAYRLRNNLRYDPLIFSPIPSTEK